MLARRFLYIVAALIVLVIAAGIAWNLFPDKMLRIAFVPKDDWASPAAPAPDYATPGAWLARPDMPHDPAHWLPRGVEAAHQQPVAIFYVLPTSALTRKSWNVAADDRESSGRQVLFARNEASVFNSVGTVWAPRYRQAVLGAFLARDANSQKAFDFAYHDVERAFESFLAQIPPGQPIILAGHSQGTLHLIRLIREHVAGTPIARRIVAAYLVGWPISISHDLPALGLPGCATASQSNCLLSWQSFAQPADPHNLVAVYEMSPGLDGKSRKGSPMLCVNPLSGNADTAAVPARLNHGALIPEKDLVSATLTQGTVPARCTPEGWLDIGAPPAGYSAYVMPGNNYHVFDYALFWANIRADAENRTRAFLR